ncbi:MAG: hypothetical protein H7Y86_04610 [Rhizobacter sp.]|nr:hypothetical protein [Ferruginibacter sp.]
MILHISIVTPAGCISITCAQIAGDQKNLTANLVATREYKTMQLFIYSNGFKDSTKL